MSHGFHENPALVVSLALVAGMISQILARHLGVPGIVILLAVGVILGPDMVGIIDTESLGAALLAVVNFAVAVILFEGALNLNLKQIRREGRAIRRLLTIGAAITSGAGTLIGMFVLGWNTAVSLLFGALLMVTGPTVINPLLRRIRVERTVATVLEAEGVFIDAIGAIIAVVVMEIVTDPVEAPLSPLNVASRLGVGSLFGLVGGGLIAGLFRSGRLIPLGLENVTTLAIALALFQVSSAVMPESGIAAVIVAGLVVGNLRPHIWRELHDFKEQLTVMLIGLLFILLAADIRLMSVHNLGFRGIAAVALLILVVRPLAVFAATHASDLTWKERTFIAWIGPRGIVAAAVASVFAVELEGHGIDGGRPLRAMVFLTIAATVVTSGLTGGWAARILGVRRRKNDGWAILGANAVAREVALLLAEGGQSVVCIDANPDVCRAAQEKGIRVIYGNGLSESVLQRAEIDTRAGAIGMTRSGEANYLFVKAVHEAERGLELFLVRGASDAGITETMLEKNAVRLFGGRPLNIKRWEQLLEEGNAHTERWRFVDPPTRSPRRTGIIRDDEETDRGLSLPLVVRSGKTVIPFAEDEQLKPDSEVTFLIHTARSNEARELLRSRGFEPTEAAVAA